MNRPLGMTHEELAQLAERLTTQDNRVTAHPLYVVQERHAFVGVDPDRWDGVVERWHHPDGDGAVTRADAVAEVVEHMECNAASVDDDALGIEGYERVYVAFEWRFVTAHFTDHAANEYIRENAHNLTDPRVYVSSQHRCDEWIAVVAMLSRKPVTAAAAPHLHDYPRIRRFDIGDEKHVRLEMGSGNSRPMSEAEIRQLRDVLNADAAERARPQSRLDVDARTFAIEKIRCIPDAFDDAHLPEDFEDMTTEQTDATWTDVHAVVSTCLIALGEETVARVTTDELAGLATDLKIWRTDTPTPTARMVERVRDQLFEMSKRAEPEPPEWTAEPPECDCWWRCQLTSGTAETRSLQWNGTGYISTTSYWSRDSLLQMSARNPLDRFLPIPGGIPVCPEVTS